jgi:hypothetical protein
MNRLIAVALVVAGIIHLLPAAGMLGPDRLQALYGVQLDDPNLVILLRHRALLFALLGLLLVAAAFRAEWRGIALAAGYASVLGFLAFASVATGYNAELARVVRADWIALAALVVATVAHFAPRDAGGAGPRARH